MTQHLRGQDKDIVVLKSSELITGTITDSIPGVSISILVLPDSILRVIPRDEIAKIVFKQGVSRKKTKKQRAREIAQEEGSIPNYYQAYLRGGFTGNGEDNRTGFLKADFINSIGFNGVFTAGLGVGARLPTDGEGLVVPLFADLRTTVISGRISPVFGVSVGAAFQPNRDFESTGLFLNPALGICLGSTYGTHLMITLGFEQFDYYGTGTLSGSLFRNLEIPVKYGHSAWTLSLLIGF
jgi:hypothetical protein